MSDYVLTALPAAAGAPPLAAIASLLEVAIAGAGAAVHGRRPVAGGLVVEIEEGIGAKSEAEIDAKIGAKMDPRTAVGSAARARAVELRRAASAALAGRGFPVDLAVQPAAWRVPLRLLVMDIDSTLITIEVIDELARRHGVGAEVAAVTERAMRGELDFEASLRARVERLAGLPVAALDEVAAGLTLSDGAARLIATLQGQGCKVAVASGGFTFAAEVLCQRLGLCAAFANRLELVGGELTGRVLGAVVTAERKAEVVRELAAADGLRPEQTAAIGDGANDRLMLAAAGFGVAFRAKPVLASAVDATIDHGGLERVLTFLGHG